MQIKEEQTLEMHNVLSFRAKMTQQELMEKAKELENIMQDNGAQRTGSVVTATFAVEQSARGVVMDMEFLLPLDREIVAPTGFVWKPHFLLTNAVVVRHIGNPSGLQESVNALNAYIAQHRLTPITVGYNVTVKEAKTPLELDDMIVDIYVGISPNLL